MGWKPLCLLKPPYWRSHCAKPALLHTSCQLPLQHPGHITYYILGLPTALLVSTCAADHKLRGKCPGSLGRLWLANRAGGTSCHATQRRRHLFDTLKLWTLLQGSNTPETWAFNGLCCIDVPSRKLCVSLPWEWDFSQKFSQEQRDYFLFFALSISSRLQEAKYKLLTCWSRVTTNLHKMFTEGSPNCKEYPISYMLDMPRDLSFLFKSQCFDIWLRWHAFFSYSKCFLKVEIQQLFDNLSPKCCKILCFVQLEVMPDSSINQWINVVNEIRLMEDLTLLLHQQEECFCKTWFYYTFFFLL